MQKQYTENQLSELMQMKDWINYITSYFVELGHSSFSTWKVDIPTDYNRNHITGFRQAFNDICLMAHDLLPTQLTELNRRLKERFGKNLFDTDKNLAKKAKKIGVRGKIKNEDEYRLLRAYLDSIEDIPEHETEYNRLYELYHSFEMAQNKVAC